jgi:hypothetical protein
VSGCVPFACVRRLWTLLPVAGLAGVALPSAAASLDPVVIGKAASTLANVQTDGVVKIGWSCADVPVTANGVRLSPAAGLGSWAPFAPMEDNAVVQSDAVMLQNEVDAAMNAALAHGLSVSGRHNHLSFDQPKFDFMHSDGERSPMQLAAVIKAVHAAHPFTYFRGNGKAEDLEHGFPAARDAQAAADSH